MATFLNLEQEIVHDDANVASPSGGVGNVNLLPCDILIFDQVRDSMDRCNK